MKKRAGKKRETRVETIQRLHDPEVMATKAFRRHKVKPYHYVHIQSKKTFKLDTSPHVKAKPGEWGLQLAEEKEDNTMSRAGHLVEKLDTQMSEWSKEDADKWASKKADPDTAKKRAEVRKSWSGDEARSERNSKTMMMKMKDKN